MNRFSSLAYLRSASRTALQTTLRALLLSGLLTPTVLAQAPVPADDGTGTRVTPNGDRFDIDGGTRSGDGQNLFHSFDRFDLNPGDTANFLTDPEIRNVLGRIGGGNPSQIHGILQLTGSNANLFLLNPAGLVFGASAQLNVPASFFATTASGIGFGNGWFEAVGSPDYAALVGTPDRLRFGANSGAIASSARLNAPDTLALLGGDLDLSGELVANRLLLHAVPGSDLLRLSSPGLVLSLDLAEAPDDPLDLPELLTGGNVELQGGTAIAQTLDVSGNTVRIESSRIETRGDARVRGNVVEFRDRGSGTESFRPDTAFALRVGGNLDLQGRRRLDINVLDRLNPVPFQIDGDLTLASDRLISADSHFRVGGTMTVQGVMQSLFDPIIDVGADYVFTSYTGASLKVTAEGDVRGGDITITQPDTAIPEDVDDPDRELLTSRPSLILEGDNIAIGNVAAGTTTETGGVVRVEASGQTTAGNINTAGTNGGGEITLNSDGDLNLGTLFSGGGAIALRSRNAAITAGNVIATGRTGGDVTLDAATSISLGAIDSEGLVGTGGTLTLQAGDAVRLNSADARGNTGGGAIAFTQASLQATDFAALGLVLGDTASIVTSAGGSLRIELTASEPPFVVGDATANGTQGSIVAGDSAIANFVTPPGTTTEGAITLISPGGDPDIAQTPDDAGRARDDIEALQRIPPRPLPDDLLLRSGAVAPEITYTDDYVDYFDLDPVPPVGVAQTREILANIEQETGEKPAIVYVQFVPSGLSAVKQAREVLQLDRDPNGDRLELVMVTAEAEPVRVTVDTASRSQVLEAAFELRSYLTNPRLRRSDRYLESAQQLYDWLIEPIDKMLGDRDIDNLTFIADTGLRTLPLAALHDGEQFLVERYSLGLIPSLSLTNTRYTSLRNAQVLAMGASVFPDRELLSPLPAVPVEVETIGELLWEGTTFLNDAFTLDNLRQQRDRGGYGIVHLATHGEFVDGSPDNSYIQLWDTRLNLNAVRTLDWSDPPVELLVLSACRTAVGSAEAELGFAGLAVAAGVKTALGSYWYVSDDGTLGLMTEFYAQLRTAPIKAEALRQAQVALLRGDVRVESGVLVTSEASVLLPPELREQIPEKSFEHPYFWSAFTLIGNPW